VDELYYGDEIAMTGPDEPTARKDFPGGFPGDKRNAFSKEGRTKEEQELFEYIRRVTQLRTELEPLRRGSLVNLHVAEQQYAYARKANSSVVVTVINNDKRDAKVEFDVTPLRLAEGSVLTDRLGVSKDVRVANGKLNVTLPERLAAIFVRK